MTADKAQATSGMGTRQKAIAGGLVVIVLVVLWQMSGMFGGGGSPSITPVAKVGTTSQSPGAGGAPAQPQQITPKPAQMDQSQQQMSETDLANMQAQKELQEKYVEAVGELQMLKLTRDIVNTNKDISSAKLATVSTDKKIIDILAPPMPVATIDNSRVTSSIQQIPAATTVAPAPIMNTNNGQDVRYNVVSVSEIQYKWSAVLSFQGRLYNVHVGDVLPPDGSTVVSIEKDGVNLMKDGQKVRISLVPII